MYLLIKHRIDFVVGVAAPQNVLIIDAAPLTRAASVSAAVQRDAHLGIHKFICGALNYSVTDSSICEDTKSRFIVFCPIDCNGK